MKFLAFCALICFANALRNVHSHKDRCQAPRIWEGRFSLRNTDQTADIEIRSMQGKLYYDAKNQRFRTVTTGRITGPSGETIVSQDMIYLRSEKKMYTLDLNTRVCISFTTDSPWYDIEIPDGAQYVGNHFIGSSEVSGGGLGIQIWTANIQNPPIMTNFTFTENGCLPVSIDIKMNGMYSSNNFYDISLGIENPDEVFRPPEECFQTPNRPSKPTAESLKGRIWRSMRKSMRFPRRKGVNYHHHLRALFREREEFRMFRF